MRKKIFTIGLVLSMLVCGVAYAASDPSTVSGSVNATPKGSAKKPANATVKQLISVGSKVSGDHALPATNINVKVEGIKVNAAKGLARCSPPEATSVSACASASRVGSGTVVATLYPQGQPSAGTGVVPCKVGIYVYYNGPGKLTYFLNMANDASSCDGILQSSVPAWAATYKEEGASIDINVPIPAYASTDAGNIDLWAAIDKETLTWKHANYHGKPVIESVGGKGSKRSYTETVKTSDSGTSHTSSLSGKSSW